MKVVYQSLKETKGLRIASTYHPPKTNSVNDISENLLSELRTKFKSLEEIKKIEAEVRK